MKVVTTKLVIFLCMFILFALIILRYLSIKDFNGICTKVIDGDTAIIGENRVRLAYIDAPEKRQISLDKVPIGEMSKNDLKSRILGKHIEVKYLETGRYGRVIATLYSVSGSNINLDMIKNGMAISYGEEVPIKYRSAEYEAKLLRKGIFSTSSFLVPSQYRFKKILEVEAKSALK